MDWQNFLNSTMKSFGNLSKEIPDTFKGFDVMGKAAKTPGALDEKTKEFIALGIAISTKCEKFTEALAMCSYMGGGPSITYSAKALEAFDEFTS